MRVLCILCMKQEYTYSEYVTHQTPNWMKCILLMSVCRTYFNYLATVPERDWG